MLEKKYHAPLKQYIKAELKFGLKYAMDIPEFVELYNQMDLDKNEDQFLDIEELLLVFADYSEVNTHLMQTMFQKDKFFREHANGHVGGGQGKLLISKLLMFALLYCKSNTEKMKILKLSLIYERVKNNAEIQWYSEDLVHFFEQMFYIPIYFMTSKLFTKPIITFLNG